MCPVARLGLAMLGLAMLGPATLALTACGPGPQPGPAPTPTALSRLADRDRLAGLAAAAKDRRYVATYLLTTPQRADRTVTVAVATDGTWLVAVPAGALGGLADVAMFSSAAGLFQCALGSAAGSSVSRPDLPPVSPGCVRVTHLATTIDPRVQHVFTDWIDPLVDRETALSVAAAPHLAGAGGDCYSVESNSAALAPPVDPGIYCFDPDGMVTGVRVSFGTLTLTGPVAPAPPTITMPGPVVISAPLPMTAPPPPPTPGVTASPH
ncbi:MAG: hypothetical protein ACM30G_06800 [Micromonosporaceae bacterium]